MHACTHKIKSYKFIYEQGFVINNTPTPRPILTPFLPAETSTLLTSWNITVQYRAQFYKLFITRVQVVVNWIDKLNVNELKYVRVLQKKKATHVACSGEEPRGLNTCK